MRALLTGGAGFIGSSVVDALVAEGYEVRVLDDLSSGFAENVNPKAELVVGDVADLGTAREAMEGVNSSFTKPPSGRFCNRSTDPGQSTSATGGATPRWPQKPSDTAPAST